MQLIVYHYCNLLQAIDLVSPTTQQRSVYFANLAACYVKMGQHKQAIEQCTSALAIDPVYIKALMRRSGAFQALDDLEHALQDAKRVGIITSSVTSFWQFTLPCSQLSPRAHVLEPCSKQCCVRKPHVVNFHDTLMLLLCCCDGTISFPAAVRFLSWTQTTLGPSA